MLPPDPLSPERVPPTPAPDHPGPIDRSPEAVTVARHVSEARGGTVVLYGRRATGKSGLIHQWVVPLLARGARVYYGQCAPSLPDSLEGPDKGSRADWGSLPAGILILDDVDRLLSLQEPLKREGLARLLDVIGKGPRDSTIVLVVCEENLRDVLALGSVAPEVLEHLFEIPQISIEDGLNRLALAESPGGRSYEPSVLAALKRDLDQFEDKTVSPALIGAVHAELKRNPRGKQNADLGLDDYRGLGGLRGILEERLARTLDQLAEAEGVEIAEAGRALLEEAVLAAASGAAPDQQDVATRLGVSDDIVVRAMAFLREPDGLLLDTAGKRIETRPVQLRQLIEEDIRQRQKEARPDERILTEAARSWHEMGSLIPRARFEALHGKRKELRVSAEAAEFMVYSALRYAVDEDIAAAGYWLSRIAPRAARISVLLRALLDTHGGTRLGAVRLLGEYDEPEVLHQLYRTALEDLDERVRREAVSGLDRLGAASFRQNLEEEARDPENPYRRSAVEALRIFRDARMTGLLQALVNDPATDRATRQTAIGTLADIRLPESVEALVNISLNDQDPEDRDDAAAGLATINSEPLQAEALRRIRDTAVEPERGSQAPRGMSVLSVPVALGAAIVVTAANVLVHGLALAALRRYAVAVGLFALELVSVALLIRTEADPLATVGVLGFVLTLTVSQVLAFQEADAQRGTSRRWLRTLRIPLYVACALTGGLGIHGAAHMMVRRFRRGFALLGLELLGVGCVLVLLVYPDLFRVEDVSAVAWWSRVTAWFYGVTAGILIAGTYAWDLAGTVRAVFQSRRRVQAEDRRRRAYAAVLATGEATSVALTALASTEKSEARWARNLVRRFASRMPSQTLLAYFARSGAGTPRVVANALKKLKDPDELPALTRLWTQADAGLRRQILRLLAARPNERSLVHLHELLPQAGRTGQFLYWWSSVKYKLRLWPVPVLVVAVWSLPFAVVLLSEGIVTARDPVHPIIARLRGRTADALSPWARPESLRHVEETTRFLARLYPGRSAKDLVWLFDSLVASTSDDPDFVNLRRAVAESLGILAALDAEMAPADETLKQAKKLGRDALFKAARHVKPSIRDAALTGLAAVADQSADEEFVERLSSLLLSDNVSVLSKTTGMLLMVSRNGKTALVRDEALDALATNVVRVKRVLSTPLPVEQGQKAEVIQEEIRIDQERKLEALEALGSTGVKEAADALKEVAMKEAGLKSAEYRVGDAEQIRELAFRALEELSLMATPEASRALKEIARDGRSEDIRDQAARLAERLPAELLNKAQEAFGAGEYAQAIGILKRLGALRNQGEPPTREETRLFAISQAYERLRAGDHEGALRHSLEAVEADPGYADAYSLVWEIDRRQGRIGEAAARFEDLIRRYPAAIIPREILSYINHEYLSKEDPSAYERAYEVNRQVQALARGAEEREMAASNFAETHLTTGRYRGAIELAGRVAAERIRPDRKEAMQVIAYAALVAAGDYKAAEGQLSELQEAVHSYPDATAGWIYDGTLNYLQKATIPEPVKGALVSLVAAVNQRNQEQRPMRELPDRLFTENRDALNRMMRAVR